MNQPGQDPNKYENTFIQVGAGAGAMIAIAVLFRIHPPLAIALSLLSLLGAVGYGCYLAYRYQRDHRDKKSIKSSFSHRVGERLSDCRQNETRFRTEGETIMQSIRTLREDLDRSTLADSVEKERAAEVIKELEAEFSLRHAKASFFADCAVRLEALLDRHRLVESISARRKELDHLRQHNFEDEATAEETRYHLQQDSIQLDTIVELGRSVATSYKAEQAEELRARLEKLRASLDD